MKRMLAPLVVALLLFAAGAVSWTLGQAEEQVARLKTQVSTMEYTALAPDLAEGAGDTGNGGDERRANGDGPLTYAARVPGLGGAMTGELRDGRATANYWLSRYDALVLERDAGGTLVERDPRLLLLAANATYRASHLDTADRDTALDRLQVIVRNYADVLRSAPTDDALIDAAYNYEFAARLLSQLERARGATLPQKLDDQQPPTIHGQPGGPPVGADTNQFRVVVPKRSDERSTEPEGGQGQDRLRRG